MFVGELVHIQITAEWGAPLRRVDEVEAVAGRGLVGGRFDRERGKRRYEARRDVTLIEIETFEALVRDHDLELPTTLSRRNLVTRGVPLNHLVGRTFRVGGAVLRGTELCEPCGHLSKLAGHDLKTLLKHRGGLRAEIVDGATLRVGDAISAE